MKTEKISSQWFKRWTLRHFKWSLLIIFQLASIATASAITQVADPVLSVSKGTSSSNVTVTVNDSTSAATIYYTTTGTAPTTSSSSISPGGTIVLNLNTTLEVQAYQGTNNPSSVITATYAANGLITSGGQHALALSSTGTISGWGNNAEGQLANGSTATVSPPVTSSFTGANPIVSSTSAKMLFTNGLPNEWMITYFGSTTAYPPTASPDGNGLTLLQDYQQGNNPTNYYSQNGGTITPALAITAGNNQPAGSGIVLPEPLTVQVTNASSGTPLANAPVTFTVTAGGGTISTSGTGTYGSQPLTVQTNSAGQAYVYFTTANPVASTNTITASTGTATSVAFAEAPPPPTNLPTAGNNNQGGTSAPPGAYGVTPVAGPVPFNAYTGNTSRTVDDLSTPAVGEIGLNWQRLFHSRLTDGTYLFDNAGVWRHSFQWDFSFVTVDSQQDIEIVYPDGTTNIFQLASGGNGKTYYSTENVDDVVINTSSGSTTSYELIRSNNQAYNFSTTTLNGSTIYYLSNIYDSKGNKTTLTWGNPTVKGETDPDDWTLNKITEPGGKYLTITYDLEVTQVNSSGTPTAAQLFITEAATSDGRTVTYAYSAWEDTNYNIYQYLSQATYSDGTSATYQFGNDSGPVTDELTQAEDVRAEGLQQINYAYYDTSTTATNAPPGLIVAIQDVSTGNVLEVNNIVVNLQQPIVSYPVSNSNTFTAYTYNIDPNQGNVLSITNSDPNHNINITDTYSYTPGTGTVSTVATDANGNTSTTVNTLSGQMLSRTYPKVGSETTAPSETWSYTTDSNNFTYLSSYKDARGYMTTYGYTANPTANQPKLLTSISYPDGTSESYTYNTTLESSHIYVVAKHTRRNGGVENYTYDTLGHLQTFEEAAQSSTQYTTYTYESTTGRLHSVEDANGHTVSYTYNDRGLVTQVTYPGSVTKGFGYDTMGRLTSVTDELSHKTSYSYDSSNRVLTATDALTNETQYAYDPNVPGNSAPIQVTLPSGKLKLFTYAMIWGYKAVQATTEGVSGVNAATTNYGYDGAGNLTSVQDPNGNTTTIAYDARNRKALVTDPSSSTTYFYYDDNGNLASLVTSEGTTTNTYDQLNRLLTSTDPKSQLTQMTYDSEGQLKTYIDPNNRTYQYSYDLDERRLSMEYPDTSTEYYAYDPVGNLHTFTTRDNKVQTFTYDTRNRDTGYTWNDGVTPSVTESFDAASRLSTISNANSALTYTYDNANKVLSEKQTVTGLAAETVSYAYNSDNTLNTLTYPDGTVLTYGYDGRNNITSVTQSGISTAVVTYGYDSNNNRTSKVLGNGITSTLTYDSVERLTSIADKLSSTTLQSFAYGYDNLSRAKYVKRATGLGDVYSYDTNDQLTGVEYGATNPDTNPTNPSRTVGYSLDAAGNRTQVTDTSASTTSYTPNSNNQYTTVAGDSLSYDGRGNLTAYSGATYTYDAEGRLTEVVNGSVTETFAYDPLGRCVATTTNGTTNYSIYDVGWNTLADYASSSSETQRYVHGIDTDEILTKTAGSMVVYYHNDGVGSVTQLTNSSGALIEQYTYDVFGLPVIENSSGGTISASQYGNRFFFAGREFVSGAGIYQYRNRAYSPSLGRFLQPDPLGHGGDSYNIYRFCANDPVNHADASGLQDDDGGDDFSGYGGDYSNVPVYYSENYSPGVTFTYSLGSGIPATFIGLPPSSAGISATVNEQPQVAIISQSFKTAGSTQPTSTFSAADAVQGTLTTLGFVPGLGEVTNAASAIVSIYQGDWTGALYSAGALIPFAGDAFDALKLARLGRKGATALRTANDILKANKAAGRAAEAQAAIDLVKEGNTIIGSQVTAKTSAGIRYIDHLIQTPTGDIVAVEVKSGNAVRSSSQLVKDNLISTEGATLGNNAGFLKGKSLKINTVERRY